MMTGSTVEVHHLFEGPEEAPVLVLSNSLGTTLGMWDEQAPALSERFRLLRYDYRGLCFPRFRRGIYEGGQG
jgi:3-oxoadipate enol-lactonase